MEINISGAEFLKEGEKEQISVMAEKTLEKHKHIGSLDVRISAHNESGERKKFVVNLIAKTERGYFNSEAFDWKLNLAVKDALSKIEKGIHKLQDKNHR